MVVAVVLVRAVVAGPGDLDRFDQFETTADVTIGPRSEYFAVGLSGDGAAYAIIAADPLGRDAGNLLFQSSYRYWRYAYPIAGRAAVFGHEESILLGLSIVNLVAVALVTYAGSYLNERIGWRAWLIVCNPAVLIGAIGDTAEPVAVAFLLYGILSGSVILAAMTSFTRPSHIVGFRSLKMLAIAGFTAAGAKAYWSQHFGESFAEGSGALGVPFAGVVEVPTVLGVLVVVAAAFTLVIGVLRQDLSWILSGVLIVCLGPAVYELPMNAVRGAGMLPVLWALGPRFSDTIPWRELFRPSLQGVAASPAVSRRVPRSAR